jgi:biotin carboxyl carrier protein
MNYKVKIAGRVFEVQIAGLNARPVIAKVDGIEIEVWPEEPGSADPAASQSVQKPGLQPLSPSQPGRQPAAATGDSLIKVVRAPIPGVIVSISVQPGSEVSTGQELCVLEAMKMKNTIRSTRSGKIASVSMQIGQHVKHHDVLMEYAE